MMGLMVDRNFVALLALYLLEYLLEQLLEFDHC